MAVKYEHRVYECGQCGWRKINSPTNDCITDSSIKVCPNCSSDCIKQVELTASELMIEKLVQLMSGRH
jgi:NAD-dependent SIR2 family protein deacetylase